MCFPSPPLVSASVVTGGMSARRCPPCPSDCGRRTLRGRSCGLPRCWCLSGRLMSRGRHFRSPEQGGDLRSLAADRPRPPRRLRQWTQAVRCGCPLRQRKPRRGPAVQTTVSAADTCRSLRTLRQCPHASGTAATSRCRPDGWCPPWTVLQRFWTPDRQGPSVTEGPLCCRGKCPQSKPSHKRAMSAKLVLQERHQGHYRFNLIAPNRLTSESYHRKSAPSTALTEALRQLC
jgi:hypothetical protein